MMFTSDQVVVDFSEYAYSLIWGAVCIIAILGLVGMIIFIYVQLNR